MNEIAGRFRNKISETGLLLPDRIIPDGEIHPFRSSPDSNNQTGWYLFHLNLVSVGVFGCWKRGLKEKWVSENLDELTPVKRNETLELLNNSELRERIQPQVLKIEDHGRQLEARYDHLKGWFVPDAEADHIIMEAVRAGACPNQYIPAIDQEWRKPRHSDFKDRTAWSLLNAFTQVNGDQKLNFEHQIPRTIKLHEVFDSVTGFEYKPNQLELPIETCPYMT